MVETLLRQDEPDDLTMWQAGVYSSVMYYLNAIKETGTR